MSIYSKEKKNEIVIKLSPKPTKYHINFTSDCETAKNVVVQLGYVKGLASLASKQAQLSSFSCSIQKARLSITFIKCIQFDT